MLPIMIFITYNLELGVWCAFRKDLLSGYPSTYIQKFFPNRNGIPHRWRHPRAISPPLFVVGYQFGRCRILQKFQYLHKFFFDGHCRCPFQVPNQILDHLKIQRKLTEHLLSACSALATVLCALVFSRMCKCNDRLFFTFCTDLPNCKFKPISVSVHVGISPVLFLEVIQKNITANYILLKSNKNYTHENFFHTYGAKKM